MVPVLEFAEWILDQIKAAPGVVLTLYQRTPDAYAPDNWILRISKLDGEAGKRFDNKFLDWKASHPMIDWSGVSEKVGHRLMIEVLA